MAPFGRSETALPMYREDRGLLHRAVPYLPPWACAAAMWPAAELSHTMWGANPWTAAGLTLASAGLTALTAKVAGGGAGRRTHATCTVAGASAWVTAATIAGPGVHPLLDMWLIGGVAGAIAWNIRRVLKTTEKANDKTENEFFKAVKLAGTKVRGQMEIAPNKVQAQLQLPPGQLTADDVSQAKGRIASGLSVSPTAVRITPDPEHHDRATLTVVPHDMLKSPTDWAGPSAPGASIAEPLVLGIYEDGEPVRLWLPGDKSVPRNATHALVMGMNGAGKSHGAKIAWTEILTRREVVLWAADPSKGKQTLRIVMGAADWVATNQDSSQAMIDCLPDVIHARASRLGEMGLDQWVPGCGLPYLVVWIEEAARLVRDSETMIDIAQQARSAGVSIVLSMQRPSYRNITVDVRQQLGVVWCYGVKSIEDAAFALSDDLIDGGANPAAWANKKPGYAYLEAPGIDDDRMVTPTRTPAATDDQLIAAIHEAAPVRDQLDPVTATAAGPAYAKRDHYSAEDATVNSINTTTTARPRPRPADPFRGRLADNEDTTPPEFPPSPEPDLDANADTELPEDTPDFQFPATKPSLEQARAMLREVLAHLQDAGKETVGPKDVPRDFLTQVRSRPWVSAELGRLADDGVLIETDRDGVYRFPDPPAAHAA
jgi:hypothetical protein